MLSATSTSSSGMANTSASSAPTAAANPPSSGTSLGYLRQEAGLQEDISLVEELWLAFPEAGAIELQLEDISSKIERGEGDLDALIEQQADIFEKFDAMDGYRIEARI